MSTSTGVRASAWSICHDTRSDDRISPGVGGVRQAEVSRTGSGESTWRSGRGHMVAASLAVLVDASAPVVDDDATQRDLVKGLLGSLGYTVSAAESGESALDQMRSSEFDLLVLDMIMPGGWDGTETLKRIRALNPHQRALIVSGYAHSDRVAAALSLGAGGPLRKPLTVSALATAVRLQLGGPPAADDNRG